MPDITNTTRLHAVPGGRRTDAEDRLWKALHDNPGSTAADLAATAVIGRSTATKILAAWDKEGSATRTSGIATGGRRPADRWSITDTDETTDAEADVDGDQDPHGDESIPSTGDATPVRLAVVPDTPTDTAVAPDPIEDVVADIAGEQPASPTSATSAQTSPTGRLAKGALQGLVEDYLAAHPGESVGPSQLGKRLGRSGGAVANALERLVTAGYAVRVADNPRRYQIADGDDTPDGVIPN
ncbi:hypothetical protein FHR81_003254 [Actinoalloteichus hoggarensis]|uniref:MarR family protein n=1 Tax=Actinoalloteichus hoggarensis TaxID=1470176 RepID=A0A221W6L7_9PSEU|nr:helix-turn-helix domain-containing protein [Actinoalloteichus hoggarensis]ASO21610.1 MarR family protein [Actinoalloteichus hoggarensis]MBB5922202.1 hypothetical protein [Actinoalloteichus hoggarensis]